MLTESTELLVLIFFGGLVASGFFSGAEAVLLSIPLERAKQLIESGGQRARALKALAKQPTELLTTILVGNNLINIFVATLASSITARFFADEGMATSVAISTGVTTLFILVFGEIIPKTFARTHAEKMALPVVRILQFCYYLFWLLVKPLSKIIQTILGDNAQLSGRIVTSNDIEFMVNQAEKEKSIDEKQINLLNSILEFPTIKVKDIMVPRSKVMAIREDSDFPSVIDTIKDVGHSRYPVYGEDLDDIKGFLHVKDLAFVEPGDRESFQVVDYLKDVFFVYEHMKIQAVFDHMNRKKVHLALVKDENGLIVGIITLEDIMEEIFGDIQDEHDFEEAQLEPSSTDLLKGVKVSGDINLRDLASDYDLKIPLNDNYSTLAGFLLEMLGDSFPQPGQIVLWKSYSFEIVEVEDAVILTVEINSYHRDTGKFHLESQETLDYVESQHVSIEKAPSLSSDASASPGSNGNESGIQIQQKVLNTSHS